MKYVILTALLIVSFCNRSNNSDEFSVNESKWYSKNINNYEFTLRINCFCPQERVGPHLIKVVNDEIVSVNNQPYDPAATGELMTIDELFTFVETGIDGNPYRKTIEYNSTYGYPQYVFFDYSKTMADEEIGYQLSDFKAI